MIVVKCIWLMNVGPGLRLALDLALNGSSRNFLHAVIACELAPTNSILDPKVLS